ncbi:MAG: hypothetical protein LAE24_09280 [Candidatus Contendobacter sp.]|jgi:hypothetical protein|nr:hypothetical protein [Candidatus Contendobacter sp.]
MMSIGAKSLSMDSLMSHDEEIERASRALKAIAHPGTLRLIGMMREVFCQRG